MSFEHEARHAAGVNVDAPALSIEGLSFSYPGADEPVLRDVALELPQGAFALLVGDTGSGKSTLLSLVKPQIAPAGERIGAIRVFGREVRELTDADSAREVGFVFQDPDNQIVCDSVWHEMAFSLENLGVPRGQMRRRVAETCYFFGMESWFRASTDELSGGRKQLLALASTLAMQPRLLLLDEPTAQLDPVAAKNFAHALFRVNRELGCTVVVATHAPELLAAYATCAYGLVEGRVEPMASPQDAVFDGPRLGALDGSCESSGNARTRASLAGRGGSAVAVRGAWFRYGRDRDWVLRGLDLEVRPGEVRALVGGNGSGKSTLLGLLAGTQRLQRGRMEVAVALRALLPQDPKALFVQETAYDELMEWSREGGYSAVEAEAMLDRLGLSNRAALHPYDLSGGQRQLLALGKLLLMRPALLLLDEPTKGLDRAARRLVARIVREERDRGATVIMATHDLEFVRSVAATASMVFDGELACTEPVDEFFQNNLFYRP